LGGQDLPLASHGAATVHHEEEQISHLPLADLAVKVRGLDLEGRALPIAVLLGEGGGPDGRVEGDIPAERAGVLGSNIAPTTLLRPSRAALARQISSLPFLTGSHQMRIEIPHHPVQEGLVEFELFLGPYVAAVRTIIEIAGARISRAGNPSRPT